MNDLVGFLLARIAEDESVAKAAADEAGAPWRWQAVPMENGKTWYGLVGKHPVQPGRAAWVIPSRMGDVYPSRDAADHIARWDPARVLAECEAKRQIVELHQPGWHLAPAKQVCDEDNWAYPCPTMRLLALPYAEHPDFREEWKP